MDIKYHFSGIAGSGMAPLAFLLHRWGYQVSGSDRFIDQSIIPEILNWAGSGTETKAYLYPQDGSGIRDDVDFLVVSSAIETTNPEVQKAVSQGVPVVKRAVLLSNLFNTGKGIAVGGTSGKSTVTSMTYWLLKKNLNPTFVNGAELKDENADGGPGSVRIGDRDFFVAETDESDKSIVLFRPAISVITNITLDHHPLEELKRLFQQFLDNSYQCVIMNADCPISSELKPGRREVISFGVNRGDLCPADLRLLPETSTFFLDAVKFTVPAPGLHNVYNALAAIAVARCRGLTLADCAGQLATYPGIKRRFDIVYKSEKVYVVDDFAHNPDKIRSAIATAKKITPNLVVIYQPHGYAPTKLVKNELVEVFSTMLNEKDLLILLPIFYAGGTANKTISSEDIVSEVRGPRAVTVNRDQLSGFIEHDLNIYEETIVMLLGARDPSLPQAAKQIADIMKNKILLGH